MLTELRPFISRIPHSYKIQMPRLRNYLDGLQRGTDELFDQNSRFTRDPIPTPGIDYINSLITRADIPYLLRFQNDVERLVKVNKEYHSPMYSDFIRQYPMRFKYFIKGRKHRTIEYMLITDDLEIVDQLPLGSDNFADWMNVRPVQMLSNDSPDIELKVTASYFMYRKNAPFEVVFSVDVVKLLMVYTKYRFLYPEEFIENTNNYPFIYKTCILPMIYDNVRTWILKSVYDIVMIKNIDPTMKYDFQKAVISDDSIFIPNNRHAALLELEDLIEKCVNGKVKPDEVINSIFIDPETNLLGALKKTMTNYFIGDYGGAQYRWLEFVKEYFLLSTVIGIYGLQPESNRSLELKRLFDVITRRLNNTRFWSNANFPFAVENIKNKFETICSLI